MLEDFMQPAQGQMQEPSPEEQLLQLLRQQLQSQGLGRMPEPQVDPNLLKSLIQSQMTQGLTLDVNNPGNPTGLSYGGGGGVVGYAGPNRVPASEQVDPSVMVYRGAKGTSAVSPEEQAQRMQVPGVGNAQQMGIIAEMMKGLPPQVQAAVMQQLSPELKIQQPLEQQMQMALFRDQLARGREAEKPLSPTVQNNLNYLNDLQNRTESLGSAVEQGLHKQFVGPLAGRTYGTRRMIPGATKEGEVEFFQDVADIKDLLVRKRSGAQISEPEAKRLANLLPKETDDPATFERAFNKFRTQLDQSIKQNKLMATQTRG